MNRRKQLICSILSAVLIFSTAGCFRKIDYEQKIRDYCKQAKTFTFSDAFDFEWDIAYVDYETYGIGSKLKEKYGLEYELPRMGDDGSYRLLIFQDDKFIQEFRYAWWKFDIDIDGDIIKPDTVFNVSWEQSDTYDELILKAQG